MRPGPRTLLALLALLALALPASAAAAKRKPVYYVSLGDSWAQGVQPLGPDQADINTKKGFVNSVYRSLRKRHRNLKLVNLGCGYSTTDSMINGTRGCFPRVKGLPYRSTSKRTSQLTYAKRWIRKHRGRIRYITLIVGGNDISPCASKTDTNEIASCIAEGIEEIRENLPVIAKGIRRAAGRKPVIVGSTYPDVALGLYVLRPGDGDDLASLSVDIFRDQINPTLRKAYRARKIGFVDATRGFGGYIPFDQTTRMEPYGVIPKAVANICRWAWFCEPRESGPDIHLKTQGYRKLAQLVLKQIRKQS